MTSEQISAMLNTFDDYRQGLISSDDLANSVTLIVLQSLQEPIIAKFLAEDSVQRR